MNELIFVAVSEKSLTLYFLGGEKKEIPLKDVIEYQRMSNQFMVLADQQYYFNATSKREASKIEKLLKGR